MKIVYLRPNGDIATNAVFQRVNEATGELMFMELMGFTNEVKGGLSVDGKEVYKRLFVQRVYPHIKVKKEPLHS